MGVEKRKIKGEQERKALHIIYLREAAKKNLFLVARPLTGGGSKALVTGPLKNYFILLRLPSSIQKKKYRNKLLRDYEEAS